MATAMVHSPKTIIICGPSGAGKSSLIRLLFEEFPERFGFSVSHTTRQPRAGEQNGKHYHFITKDEMKKAIERNEFIENAEFSNNMYGTSKSAVLAVAHTGKICVLDIDTAGVKQVKNSDLSSLYVFVRPPSMDDLEKRLRDRGTETEESLQKRLSCARREIEYGESAGNFDLVLTNDDLDKAYNCLKEFIKQNLFTQQIKEGGD